MSLLSTITKKSVGIQTTNMFTDPKSLTYLIRGLIFRSLSHFLIDERKAFIGSCETEGECKIINMDSWLSSISLYCEYELEYSYYIEPGFMGYPIIFKSPYGGLVTGLDHSKTKFIDNNNYVIEFIYVRKIRRLQFEYADLADTYKVKKAGPTLFKSICQYS